MRLGLRHPRWLYLLFLTGCATLLVRTLLDSDFRGSGLLYLGVPFLIAIAMHQFVPRPPRADDAVDLVVPRAHQTGSMRHGLVMLRDGTIIMLATSAILFEGFLCVAMFLPIFWFAMAVALLTIYITERQREKHGLKVYALPALLAVLAVEGVSPQLSFSRDAVVTRSLVVDASPAAIKAHLAKPIRFAARDNLFLSLFPLPDGAFTGSLNQGDVHRLHFTYKRWFVTNVHQGEMHVQLAEVSDRRIRTAIVRNDAYLSHYMAVHGTQVDLSPMPDGKTRVSLSVRYTRLLDPYWYFGPMQHYAVEKSADYLLRNVIDPGPDGV
jgi:hypothetical protein